MTHEVSIRELRHNTASVRAGENVAAQQLETGRKLRRHDAWIAATALHHKAAVLTQDAEFSVQYQPGSGTSR